MLINNRELMGEHVNSRPYNLLAWAITIIVGLLSLSLIIITVLGWFGVQLWRVIPSTATSANGKTALALR